MECDKLELVALVLQSSNSACFGGDMNEFIKVGSPSVHLNRVLLSGFSQLLTNSERLFWNALNENGSLWLISYIFGFS